MQELRRQSSPRQGCTAKECGSAQAVAPSDALRRHSPTRSQNPGSGTTERPARGSAPILKRSSAPASHVSREPRLTPCTRSGPSIRTELPFEPEDETPETTEVRLSE